MRWTMVLLLGGCAREIGITSETRAPQAKIVAPIAGSTVPEALPLSLRGTVSDPDTRPADLVTRWLLRGEVACASVTPDDEGVTTCQVLSLTPGSADITLEVEDPEGESARAESTVTILPSSAPTADLDPPGTWVESEATLSGRFSDADDSLEALMVWFESSLDGRLTTPVPPRADGTISAQVTLSPGPQNIVLWVEDPLGLVGNDSASTTVVAVDAGPTVSFEAPRDGSRHILGQPVALEAQVTDPDDPFDVISAVWSSDIDGELARGGVDASWRASLRVDDLSLGDHEVTIEVSDPAGRSAQAAIELTIDGAPSAPEIRITPADPLTDDTLRVLVDTDSVDPNGDPVSYIFAWTQASEPDVVSVGELLSPSDTQRGELWTATVTPWDGLQEGEPATADVLIGNSPPSATVELSPEEPDTTTDLIAVWELSDPDEADLLTASLSWTIDGEPAGDGELLPAGSFVRGDRVEVTVTPSDGELAGTPALTEVVIGNARPTAPLVAIVPREPLVDDDLQCLVIAESSDPDGDEILYTFDWERDGEVFGAAVTTDWPQDTVPYEHTGPDQTWTCTVVPVDDSFTTGPSGWDEITVPCVTGQDVACPAASCLAILEDGLGDGDGTYWIQPGSTPLQATCDLTTDGGGWTLVGRVHRAEIDGVLEPVGWFGAGNNPGPLVNDRELLNEAPSAHGSARFIDYFETHPEPVARFRLIGSESGRIEQTWFKGAPLAAYSRWFADDDTPTPVCADEALSVDCIDGTITSRSGTGRADGATTLAGFDIAPDCPLHMRLDDDLGALRSAVSACDEGLVVPSRYADEWGHGMEIWLR